MTRERPLAPSRFIRETIAQPGGMHSWQDLADHAREAIRTGSRSFATASALFDRTTRERVWLLYAWCRRCDDLADAQDHGGKPGAPAGAQARLKAIRVLTARALDGMPTADPAFDALGLVSKECGIPSYLVDEVISGFALDADGWRPGAEEDLMRYCYRVAGAVGVMTALTMGVPSRDDEMLDRACDLGLAFQLCNIARDMGEDAAAGRCYLPANWLAELDIPPGRHMEPAYLPLTIRLVERLAALAKTYECSARIGARRLPFRQRWAVFSAAGIYGAIAREVVRRGEHAWEQRVRISRLAKLGFVIRGLWEAVIRPAPPGAEPKWRRSMLAEPRNPDDSHAGELDEEGEYG